MEILYIDMDGTLVDFEAGIHRVTEEELEKYGGDYDDIPGFFQGLPPLKGAIEAYTKLSEAYDTYILSTAPWNNPTAWSDKVEWVRRHLPVRGKKRLILSHHKHLVRGDYLVDDRQAHGADRFEGEHIQIHTGEWPDWGAVLDYLL